MKGFDDSYFEHYCKFDNDIVTPYSDSEIRFYGNRDIHKYVYSTYKNLFKKEPNLYLDLGCGTGEEISYFLDRNITSAGCDISDYVFNDTPSLQSITVDSNNPAYDSRDNCNALIETASNTLMAGCQNTVIPTSVTSIGKSAFHQCSTLTSITIPRNVVRIGEGAFSWCKGLTTITSHITSPFTVTNIGFSEEVYQTATLYVPQGTKALYEATEGWKQFANIVEMGGEEETPAEAIDLGLPSG